MIVSGAAVSKNPFNCLRHAGSELLQPGPCGKHVSFVQKKTNNHLHIKQKTATLLAIYICKHQYCILYHFLAAPAQCALTTEPPVICPT